MPHLTSGPQYAHFVEVLSFSGSGFCASKKRKETRGGREEERRSQEAGRRKSSQSVLQQRERSGTRIRQ
jgi:hypothetical protein